MNDSVMSATPSLRTPSTQKHYRYKGRSWILGRSRLIGISGQQCDNIIKFDNKTQTYTVVTRLIDRREL